MDREKLEKILNFEISILTPADTAMEITYETLRKTRNYLSKLF